MNKVFIGNKLIEKDEIEAFIVKAEELFEGKDIHSGDILVCASECQFGTYIQWNFCKRNNIIPFLIAPDYDIFSSDFLKYTDVRYLLRIDSKMNMKLEEINGSRGKHIDIEDAAVIHMTSATTGNPKFILRTKKNLDLEMIRYCKAAGITNEDTMMSIAPYYHAYAFVGPLLGCEYSGADLVFPDLIMPRNIISLCKDMKVSYLYGVPFFFSKMVEVDKKYMLGTQIKKVVSSGEKLEESLWFAFKERFDIELTQQYGSTETGTITICDPNDPPECQGHIIEGNEIVFKNEDSKNVMMVNTHGTMGYYLGDEITPIAEGFYETNDVGFFDDANRLFIDGRKDDIIIKAGEKINLKHISKVISSNPQIDKAAVKLDVNSPLKELICYYEASDREEDMEEALRLFCKERLSTFQIPKKFIKANIIAKNNWKHQEA